MTSLGHQGKLFSNLQPSEYFQMLCSLPWYTVPMWEQSPGAVFRGPGGKTEVRSPEFCFGCSCVALGSSLNFSGLCCPLSGTGVGLRVFIPSSLPHKVAGKLWGAPEGWGDPAEH